MTTYPGTIDNFREVENLPGTEYDPADTKTVYAEDTNNHSDAIIAIETTLGTNPQGDAASVADRLDDIEGMQPFLHVAADANFAVNNTTDTVIPYDTVIADNFDAWDDSNKRYVIPKAGLYLLQTGIWFSEAITSGDNKQIFRNNGGAIATNNARGIESYETILTDATRYFDEGDLLDAIVFQSTGGTLNCDAYTDTVYMTATYLHA